MRRSDERAALVVLAVRVRLEAVRVWSMWSVRVHELADGRPGGAIEAVLRQTGLHVAHEDSTLLQHRDRHTDSDSEYGLSTDCGLKVTFITNNNEECRCKMQAWREERTYPACI